MGAGEKDSRKITGEETMMVLSRSDMPSCGSLVRRGGGLFRCGYVGDCPQHGPNTVYERFIKIRGKEDDWWTECTARSKKAQPFWKVVDAG